MGAIADAMTEDSTKPIDCLEQVELYLSKLNDVVRRSDAGRHPDGIHWATSKLLFVMIG